MTRLEDLADMTLIDENTKLIQTDNMINDANDAKNFLLIQVAPPGGQISYLYKWRQLVAKFLTYTSGAIWWPNFLLIQVAPPGDQIRIRIFQFKE